MQAVQGTFISPAKTYIDFQPNLEQDVTFLVGDAAQIRVNLGGGLAQYASLLKTEEFSAQNLKGQAVTIHLKLPEFIKTPGKNIIEVSAAEVPQGGDMIGTATTVVAFIVIVVPFPGVFVLTDFAVPNINENETLPVTIYASNYGYENITASWGDVQIVDMAGQTIAELKTDTKPLASRVERQSYAVKWASKGYKGGEYLAKAAFHYRTNTSYMSRQFKIGSLSVGLINYTRTAGFETISPFEVIVQSLWNSRITNQYAIVSVGNTTFQTPSTDLEPWETKTMKTYFDTKNMKPGMYQSTIILKYDGGTNSYQGIVEITTPAKKKLTEQPMIVFGGLGLIALLIIVAGLMLLLMRGRRKNEP
ncbi:MAG: hypothetical protein V1837_03115 [Candidatus Woesearchaeota archaeon]